MKSRQCPNCKKNFTPAHNNPNQKYCSRICYKQNPRDLIPRVKQKCPTCGREFEKLPSQSRQFCSYACSLVFNRKKRYRKIHLDREYLTRRKDNKEAHQLLSFIKKQPSFMANCAVAAYGLYNGLSYHAIARQTNLNKNFIQFVANEIAIFGLQFKQIEKNWRKRYGGNNKTTQRHKNLPKQPQVSYTITNQTCLFCGNFLPKKRRKFCTDSCAWKYSKLKRSGLKKEVGYGV